MHFGASGDSRHSKHQFGVRFHQGDEHQSISYLSEIVIIQNAAVGHLRILQTYIIIIIMAVVAMVGGLEKE